MSVVIGLVDAFGQSIVQAALGFARCELIGLTEGNRHTENGVVACDADILVGDVDKPEVVVAEGCACAEVHTFVPPVQNIAFGKLVGSVIQDLPTGIIGIAVEDAHHVLQLVAEASCAAHLIECGTCKQTRGVDLVEIPAVEHIVETGIRRVDLNV